MLWLSMLDPAEAMMLMMLTGAAQLDMLLPHGVDTRASAEVIVGGVSTSLSVSGRLSCHPQ